MNYNGFIENSIYEILTPNGFEDFKGVQKTTRTEYVEIYFTDGSKLRTSLKHKTYSDNNTIFRCNIHSNSNLWRVES